MPLVIHSDEMTLPIDLMYPDNKPILSSRLGGSPPDLSDPDLLGSQITTSITSYVITPLFDSNASFGFDYKGR